MKVNVYVESDKHPELYSELAAVNPRARCAHLRALSTMACEAIHIGRLVAQAATLDSLPTSAPVERKAPAGVSLEGEPLRLFIRIPEPSDLFDAMSAIAINGRAERLRMLATMGLRIVDVGVVIQQAGLRFAGATQETPKAKKPDLNARRSAMTQLIMD